MIACLYTGENDPLEKRRTDDGKRRRITRVTSLGGERNGIQ